jgi:hypothetical protein
MLPSFTPAAIPTFPESGYSMMSTVAMSEIAR